MDKKIKGLLISLGIVSLSILALAAWIYISMQAEVARYAKEHAELEKQNTYLQGKLGDAQKSTRHWQEKSEAVSADLNRLDREHSLLLSQYDSLLKEKETLTRENKGLKDELERLEKLYSQAREKARLGASDKSLASLLKEKANLQVKVEKLKAKIAAQERKFENIEAKARPAREKAAQLEKEKAALEEDLAAAQKISDLLSNDLAEEQKKKSALERDLAKNEKQLTEIMRERDKLSAKLSEMKQALEQRLAELNQTKKVLETVVEGVKEVVTKEELASIQLPPIIVKADLPAKESSPKLKEERLTPAGRIITVNDKYKFVVVDIGSDAGVEEGMNFDVYRRDKKVAEIEVIETRKNIAACDIKQLNVKGLKVNDTVSR